MLSDFQAALDPAKEYEAVAEEFFRCCLLRTLLSYEGVPADEGGAVLRPDLADRSPIISDDGLTWTFSIRRGVWYAPPFESMEVTSPDFVRALEREADPEANVGGYSFYYSVIQGFDAFAAGKASSITGLSTPDEATLRVHLTEPAGDLGYRFALPATAPIPPVGSAPMGAAAGHEADYGRFLVPTGPYMVEGTNQLDFSVPVDRQQATSGYDPGRSLVLVRNPSWDAATDPLRPAHVDRIEVTFGGEMADVEDKVSTGDLDLLFDTGPPPEILREYSSDPARRPQLHVHPADSVFFVALNVLQPPFDDLHVRKAVSLVLDKAGLRTLMGGDELGELAGHIMPDDVIGGALEGYDPYATPGSRGDPMAARGEMALSRYGDDEGMCGDPSCREVLAFTIDQDVYERQAALIADDLAKIGITLNVRALQISTMYAKCASPAEHHGMCLALGWAKDYPDGNAFGASTFSSDSIFPACCNVTFVGAAPSLLRENGYRTTDVPNVDGQIDACTAEVGDARIDCWADFDRTLMESVVGWIPWMIGNGIWITSERVTGFSFDQSMALPALDRLILEG